jgi:hypothetical protein
MLCWLEGFKREQLHRLHLIISHVPVRTCREKLVLLARFPWPAASVQHVHKYATPLHAMASAVVQSRTTDGQDDDNSGLDDAVWDALQDSDEVQPAYKSTCHVGFVHLSWVNAHASC